MRQAVAWRICLQLPAANLLNPIAGAPWRTIPTNEKRILIVDDDDAIRGLLCTILSRRGFTVDTARNGIEALARLRTCTYSAIDLDPEVVAGSIRKPFDVEVLIDMVTACVTVLTPRPQPP